MTDYCKNDPDCIAVGIFSLGGNIEKEKPRANVHPTAYGRDRDNRILINDRFVRDDLFQYKAMQYLDTVRGESVVVYYEQNVTTEIFDND